MYEDRTQNDPEIYEEYTIHTWRHIIYQQFPAVTVSLKYVFFSIFLQKKT